MKRYQVSIVKLVASLVVLTFGCLPTVSFASGLGVCGSTKTQRALVPDSLCVFPNGDVRPYACNMPHAKLVSFQAACTAHDQCYGLAGATKSTCDSRFYKGLTDSCRSTLSSSFPERGRKACYSNAALYNDVVRSPKGCEAFKKAQAARNIVNPQCN